MGNIRYKNKRSENNIFEHIFFWNEEKTGKSYNYSKQQRKIMIICAHRSSYNVQCAISIKLKLRLKNYFMPEKYHEQREEHSANVWPGYLTISYRVLKCGNKCSDNEPDRLINPGGKYFINEPYRSEEHTSEL